MPISARVEIGSARAVGFQAGSALMALVKSGVIVDDPWRLAAPDEPLPADEPVIISKARYLAGRDALQGRNAPLGLLIEAGEGLADLKDADIARFSLIAL